jgi:hypothetical protein
LLAINYIFAQNKLREDVVMQNNVFKDHIKEDIDYDIAFYQNYIEKLYLPINKKRDFEDLYGYLHRTAGYLGKSIILKNITLGFLSCQSHGYSLFQQH